MVSHSAGRSGLVLPCFSSKAGTSRNSAADLRMWPTPNFANCSTYPALGSRSQEHRKTGMPMAAHCNATVDCTVKAKRVFLHNSGEGAPAITPIFAPLVRFLGKMLPDDSPQSLDAFKGMNFEDQLKSAALGQRPQFWQQLAVYLVRAPSRRLVGFGKKHQPGFSRSGRRFRGLHRTQFRRSRAIPGRPAQPCPRAPRTTPAGSRALFHLSPDRCPHVAS